MLPLCMRGKKFNTASPSPQISSQSICSDDFYALFNSSGVLEIYLLLNWIGFGKFLVNLVTHFFGNFPKLQSQLRQLGIELLVRQLHKREVISNSGYCLSDGNRLSIPP